MSKSSCRFVVTKKDDCCYKTTTVSNSNKADYLGLTSTVPIL